MIADSRARSGAVATLRRNGLPLARELAALVVRWSGVPALLRETYARHRVSILVYHDPAPAVLDRHLAYLSKHYTFTTMSQVVASRREQRRLPEKSLVVTLDDGHRGNAELVATFLKHGVVPTIYLCSQIVGTNRHFWWTKTADPEALKLLPNRERLAALASGGFAETTEYAAAERQALSTAEIELLRPIAELGAHTRFHPILPRCDGDEAMSEIAGSKAEIERMTATSCAHFSYPNGDASPRDVEAVRAAGFESARTIDPGWNDDATDLFRLKIIGAPDDASVNRLAASVVTLFAKQLAHTRGHRTAGNADAAIPAAT